MKRRAIGVVLALLLPVVVAADDHPRTVGARTADQGHEWQAASRVLDANGAIKATRMPAVLRRNLEDQLLSAASMEHGLEDGDIPRGGHCDGWWQSAHWPEAEAAGAFAPMLLLAEVAVVARLGEGVAGFDRDGSPMMLFALTDVERLHPRSYVPDFLLLPFDGLVIHGRAFCGMWMARPWRDARHPASGDRVVLVGRWHRDGVLRAVPEHPDAVGLAQIMDDDGLLWNSSFGVRDGGPGSLPELRERVDEAVIGGLFAVSAPLMAHEYGAPERREWARAWAKLHEDGCRVTEVVHRPDLGLVPVRKCRSARP